MYAGFKLSLYKSIAEGSTNGGFFIYEPVNGVGGDGQILMGDKQSSAAAYTILQQCSAIRVVSAGVKVTSYQSSLSDSGYVDCGYIPRTHSTQAFENTGTIGDVPGAKHSPLRDGITCVWPVLDNRDLEFADVNLNSAEHSEKECELLGTWLVLMKGSSSGLTQAELVINYEFIPCRPTIGGSTGPAPVASNLASIWSKAREFATPISNFLWEKASQEMDARLNRFASRDLRWDGIDLSMSA